MTPNILIAAGTLGLLGAGSAALSLLPGHDAASATPVAAKLPAERPAALVAATTGSALNAMRAVGDQAKVINAALPFATDPVRAAKKFVLSGDNLDEQRALLCLTQAVYYEAGFEPMQGRRAVAQVVLNRMRHPAFPKSICGVVYQGAGTGVCQFTFVCDGALDRRPATGAWEQAEQIARAALGGYVEKSVGEATHYHADYVAPRWAPLLSKVAVIGQHIFYRWPGGWGQPAAFTGRYAGEPLDPSTMKPAITAPAVVQTDGTTVQLAQADIPPPFAHAPEDVGGLLDTSKGWTLHIPGPDESSGAAAKAIAEQLPSPAPDTKEVAATSVGIADSSSK